MGNNCSKKHSNRRYAAGQDAEDRAASTEVACYDLPINVDAAYQGAIFDIFSMSNALGSRPSANIIICGQDSSLVLMDLCLRNVTRKWIGHSKAVNKVIASKDGASVFSCSRDLRILQWDFSNDGPVQSFEGHDLNISSITFNEGAKVLASGSRDTSVKLWDIQSGSLIQSKKTPRNLVTCMTWLSPHCTYPCSESAASNVLAVGGEDLRVRLYDTRQTLSQPTTTLGGYTYFPLSIDAYHDHDHDHTDRGAGNTGTMAGHFLCTANKGFDGMGCDVWVWDLRMNRTISGGGSNGSSSSSSKSETAATFYGHNQDVTAVSFLHGNVANSGGMGLISGSKDGSLKWWQLNRPPANNSNAQNTNTNSDSPLHPNPRPIAEYRGGNYTALSVLPPRSLGCLLDRSVGTGGGGTGGGGDGDEGAPATTTATATTTIRQQLSRQGLFRSVSNHDDERAGAGASAGAGATATATATASMHGVGVVAACFDGTVEVLVGAQTTSASASLTPVLSIRPNEIDADEGH